ncbi:DUF2846 domain-containing protein [Amphritea atlantica]|nr:DUF2846 domain-containing protein [Amphritea atlantica]
MRKLIVLIITVLGLYGCSATGPVFKPVETTSHDRATVYIYRPYVFFNAGGWPEIYVDEKKLFALKNQGYGVVHLRPGEHQIKAEGSMLFTNWYPGPMEISHNFKANHEYYVRVTPQMTDAMVVGSIMTMAGKANVSIIPKENAIKEISDTKKIIDIEI